MARRLVSGAKEATAGLRIARKRVLKNRHRCCDQVANREEPGTPPGSVLTQTSARAGRQDSTLRTTGRLGKCQRKQLDPCTGAEDRPWHECASSLPARW